MSRAARVFVLTGAGVSAESGLGTFRDKGGIWARFDPMQLATPEAFARDPDRTGSPGSCFV
jgi:NAD-dependent deacetylase